jgi:hypothetical protein
MKSPTLMKLQFRHICRTRYARTDYVTTIYTMKKMLLPLFSLLIAGFLSSCASEEPVTTTTTTTRQTTVTQPTATQQTTTTRY